MNQLDPKIEELIIARLSGTANEQGNKELEAWLSEAPEHQSIMRRCQEIWFDTMVEHDTSRFKWTKGYAKFKQQIEARKEKDATPPDTSENDIPTISDLPSRWQRMGAVLRYAAVIIAIVGVTAVASISIFRNNLTKSMADIMMSVPKGSTMTTSLPDGTKVCLNGGTSLRYSQAYGINNRSVTLSGEAYFDIVHHKEMPLDITVGTMHIRDIGTKFNISNYPDDPQAIVTVDEGSIDIKTTAISKTMRVVAGQKAVVDKASGEVNVAPKSCGGDSWSKGLLVFKNNTVEEIARQLERSFDVTIRIHSATTARKRFFGTFSRNRQNINDILNALMETGTLGYAINGRQVDIY